MFGLWPARHIDTGVGKDFQHTMGIERIDTLEIDLSELEQSIKEINVRCVAREFLPAYRLRCGLIGLTPQCVEHSGNRLIAVVDLVLIQIE